MEEAAATVGAHIWTERAAFALLGAWSPAAAEPSVTVMLDRHSAHCAWRAGELEGRLPVLAGVDRPALVAPPAPGLARCLAAAETVDGDTERLAVAYRVVLPRLVAGYRRHLAATSDAADAPTRRSLRLVLADAAEDWAEGEAALQAALAGPGGGPGEVARVGALVASLESLAVAS